MLYITDVHPTMSKQSDHRIGSPVARRNVGDLRSLAAERDYDAEAFRDELRAKRHPSVHQTPHLLLTRSHTTPACEVIEITSGR